MKHLPLNPKIFIENRKRFIKEMKPNSIAIFNSNDEVSSNGDALYRFQQNSDLYWLCGIEQEDTMVVLFPDNPDPKYREVLVLVRPNEMKEKLTIVRVNMPRSELLAYGINASPENWNDYVKTDLLVGVDGVPQAIRLVR